MKICVVQTKPIKGDIQKNIEKHKKLIDLAVANEAGTVIFPELSLMGYEPTLAQKLATLPSDPRLNEFQQLSNAHHITIGVGMPTKNGSGICISMILFRPHQERQIYAKRYLHPDEEEFFVSGQNFPFLQIEDTRVALAICYELSISAHAQTAFEHGAEVYIASVAKSAKGVAAASKRLANIARQQSVPVLMSNCVGPSDNFESAGKSSVWNSKGRLLGQLDNAHEGLIIYDTHTQALYEMTI